MGYDGFYLIRSAEYADLMDAAEFYRKVCKGLEKGVNYPHWEWGARPCEEELYSAIQAKDLYLARDGIKIVGGFILTRQQPAAFAGVDWGCDLPESEVGTLELLASLPAYKGRHVGQCLMDRIVSLAGEQGLRAIRLDCVPDNAPAIRLYKRNGFQEIATVDMGLGMYGLPWMTAFQLLL